MEKELENKLLNFPHLIDYDEDSEDYEEESLAISTPLKNLKMEKKAKTLAEEGFNAVGESESSESEFENIEQDKELEVKLNLEVLLEKNGILFGKEDDLQGIDIIDEADEFSEIGENAEEMQTETDKIKHKMSLLVSVSEDNLLEETTADATVDLVCLIDCSGSMDGHKLAEVQKSLIYMIELMGDNDRMSLICFNSQATILNSLRVCSIENKRGRLRTKIQNLRAMGGTNIVGGLQKALKMLSKRTTKNQITSIFLLSDGNDSYKLQGLDVVFDAYDPKIGDYSIHTFGYGSDHDPELMTSLAEQKGGSFYYIEDLSTVDEAFIDCLGLLKSSVGYSAIAKLTFCKESEDVAAAFNSVQFGKVYGQGWMNDKQVRRESAMDEKLIKTTKFLKIGHITIGMRKDYVCELELEEGVLDTEKSLNLIRVELIVTKDTAKGAKKVRVQSQYGEITLIPKSEILSSKTKIEVNEEVGTQLLRIQGAQVMKKARKFMFQDKLDEAKSVFDNFQTSLNKFKKLDVILDNLRSDVGRAQVFLQQPQAQKPHAPQRRMFTHSLQQRAHNYSSQSSNPYWSKKGMYENTRQKKMKTKLAFMKNCG